MNTPAKRKAAQRAREREIGLIYVTVRIRQEDKEKVKKFANNLESHPENEWRRRAEIMYSAMKRYTYGKNHKVWDVFSAKYPEANDWFDEG